MWRTCAFPLFILLLLSACEKPEDILPVPAPQSGQPLPPPAPEPLPDDEKPAVDVGSEVFQYGRFGEIPYRYLIPRGYDSTNNYPLHIFLHGMGERGVDNEKHLSAGSAYFQLDSVRRKYPALVVYPQCPPHDYWFTEKVMIALKGLVDSLVSRYAIDERRITIGGFSMGAYGTFAIVAEYPGLFEAAVAISGDGDEELAERMARPRWHLFAGGRDEVVSSNKTQRMARALEKAGASVFFTLYPNADHRTVLKRAFEEPDFFSWLFKKDQPHRTGS